MPILRRIADKAKAFLARFTRRRRSRNRNQASAGYQEGVSKRRSSPSPKGAGSGPSDSLPNARVSATNAVDLSAVNSAAVDAIHRSAQADANVAQGSLPLPPAGALARSRFRCPVSSLQPSTNGRLHGTPFASPTPPNAKVDAHGHQSLHHDLSNPSSGPSILQQSPQGLYAAPSYLSNASGFSIGQVGTGNVQYFGSSRTVFDCEFGPCLFICVRRLTGGTQTLSPISRTVPPITQRTARTLRTVTQKRGALCRRTSSVG